MRQLRNWADERQLAGCAYCGGNTATRDHVPSRSLLDEPYPENLPVVASCEACNSGFSFDEEYVACLVECASIGSATPSDMTRPKVRRTLERRPALATRLAAAHIRQGETSAFTVEEDRVRNVLIKLCRGHALYELNEPHPEEPRYVGFAPLTTLSDEAHARFESCLEVWVVPEVGSRAMQRLFEDGPWDGGWVVVQPGRYRYLAHAAGKTTVRVVLSEYLAGEVVWE